MIGGSHFDAAKMLYRFSDARIVGRDDNLLQRLGLPASFDHVLNEWLAGNQRQRLAGEPAGRKSRGNYANDSHRRLRSAGQPYIERLTIYSNLFLQLASDNRDESPLSRIANSVSFFACRFTNFIVTVAGATVKCWCDHPNGKERLARIAERNA
jgi:hypothetical protein